MNSTLYSGDLERLDSMTDYAKMHQCDTFKGYTREELDLLMSSDMPESVKIKILASYNKAKDAPVSDITNKPSDNLMNRQ